MDTVLLTYLAIGTYVTAFGLRAVMLESPADPQSPHARRWTCALLGSLAVAIHGAALLKANNYGAEINFSLLHAMSLVMLVTNTLVLLTSFIRPAEQLGIVTFPLTATILLIGQFVSEPIRNVHNPSLGMSAHILSSLLAFSFLGIAAIQATLLSIQDACLRRRHFKAWILRSLPSLESMETLMFRLIGMGFIFLSASLASGFLFLEDMFAQHLAHKTILTLLAWVIFGILMLGRMRFGWRGIVAIRWTLIGFLALLLGYFGSKFVIELILKRS
jgi:ABC-type uncharacterized transport system permease subunit